MNYKNEKWLKDNDNQEKYADELEKNQTEKTESTSPLHRSLAESYINMEDSDEAGVPKVASLKLTTVDIDEVVEAFFKISNRTLIEDEWMAIKDEKSLGSMGETCVYLQEFDNKIIALVKTRDLPLISDDNAVGLNVINVAVQKVLKEKYPEKQLEEILILGIVGVDGRGRKMLRKVNLASMQGNHANYIVKFPGSSAIDIHDPRDSILEGIIGSLGMSPENQKIQPWYDDEVCAFASLSIMFKLYQWFNTDNNWSDLSSIKDQLVHSIASNKDLVKIIEALRLSKGKKNQEELRQFFVEKINEAFVLESSISDFEIFKQSVENLIAPQKFEEEELKMKKSHEAKNLNESDNQKNIAAAEVVTGANEAMQQESEQESKNEPENPNILIEKMNEVNKGLNEIYYTLFPRSSQYRTIDLEKKELHTCESKFNEIFKGELYQSILEIKKETDEENGYFETIEKIIQEIKSGLEKKSKEIEDAARDAENTANIFQVKLDTFAQDCLQEVAAYFATPMGDDTELLSAVEGKMKEWENEVNKNMDLEKYPHVKSALNRLSQERKEIQQSQLNVKRRKIMEEIRRQCQDFLKNVQNKEIVRNLLDEINAVEINVGEVSQEIALQDKQNNLKKMVEEKNFVIKNIKQKIESAAFQDLMCDLPDIKEQIKESLDKKEAEIRDKMESLEKDAQNEICQKLIASIKDIQLMSVALDVSKVFGLQAKKNAGSHQYKNLREALKANRRAFEATLELLKEANTREKFQKELRTVLTEKIHDLESSKKQLDEHLEQESVQELEMRIKDLNGMRFDFLEQPCLSKASQIAHNENQKNQFINLLKDHKEGFDASVAFLKQPELSEKYILQYKEHLEEQYQKLEKQSLKANMLMETKTEETIKMLNLKLEELKSIETDLFSVEENFSNEKIRFTQSIKNKEGEAFKSLRYLGGHSKAVEFVLLIEQKLKEVESNYAKRLLAIEQQKMQKAQDRIHHTMMSLQTLSLDLNDINQEDTFSQQMKVIEHKRNEMVQKLKEIAQDNALQEAMGLLGTDEINLRLQERQILIEEQYSFIVNHIQATEAKMTAERDALLEKVETVSQSLKEARLSSEMTFAQLEYYIQDVTAALKTCKNSYFKISALLSQDVASDRELFKHVETALDALKTKLLQKREETRSILLEGKERIEKVVFHVNGIDPADTYENQEKMLLEQKETVLKMMHEIVNDPAITDALRYLGDSEVSTFKNVEQQKTKTVVAQYELIQNQLSARQKQRTKLREEISGITNAMKARVANGIKAIGSYTQQKYHSKSKLCDKLMKINENFAHRVDEVIDALQSEEDKKNSPTLETFEKNLHDQLLRIAAEELPARHPKLDKVGAFFQRKRENGNKGSSRLRIFKAAIENNAQENERLNARVVRL